MGAASAAANVCVAKDRIFTPERKSNVSGCKSCPALGLDPISVNKREDNWDLKVDDVKTLVLTRVDFEDEKVNDLFKVDELLCLHRSKCKY